MSCTRNEKKNEVSANDLSECDKYQFVIDSLNDRIDVDAYYQISSQKLRRAELSKIDDLGEYQISFDFINNEIIAKEIIQPKPVEITLHKGFEVSETLLGNQEVINNQTKKKRLKRKNYLTK